MSKVKSVKWVEVRHYRCKACDKQYIPKKKFQTYCKSCFEELKEAQKEEMERYYEDMYEDIYWGY